MRRLRVMPLVAMLSVLTLVAAACAQETDQEPGGESAEELVIGSILPQTGDLAFLGPPMTKGVEMAVQEIQDAGGPLDHPVRLVPADETSDAAVASEAADRLLGEGAHAIVGAAASGQTRAIIDSVTGAGVVQCSPSNTSAEFTTWDDDGYYIRTAPPDTLQSQVLAEVILGDDHERVAILARADGYGRGLADSTEENLTDGGADVVLNSTYDPDATTFDAEVNAVRGENPDAVVVVSFEEGVQLIQGLLEAGFGADQIYGVDGNQDSGLNTKVDPGNANVLDGMKGTAPTAAAVEGFVDRFKEFAPEVENTLYAPQAYDCTMLIALAAVAAESISSEAIRDNIVEITTGDNECSGFQECAEFLGDDETISYQFASGTRSFSDAGEPTNGVYEIWGFVNGEMTALDSREVSDEDQE